MNPNLVYLVTAYCAATLAFAAVGVALALSTWRRRQVRAALVSTLVSCMGAGYLLARGLSLLGPAAWADFWLRVEWLFMAVAPVGLLSLALAYTGGGQWWTPRRLAALLVIPILTQVFVWQAVPGLLMPSGPLISVGPFWLSAGRPTGLWLVVHLGYAAILLALALNTIGRVFLRAAGAHRRPAAWLLGSLIVFSAASAAEAAGVWVWPGLPLSPWALLAVAAIFASAILRQLTVGGISVTVARAIEFTPDAVCVCDPEQRILFVNAAAEAAFGISAAVASGQPAGQCLPLWSAVQPKLDPAQPVRTRRSGRVKTARACTMSR